MNDDMNKTTIQGNPADAGQDNSNNQTADNTQQQKFFTQEELERILAERLKREKEKYKDYEQLKKAAEELQTLKQAQMTEQEKLEAKLKKYEQLLLQKEQEAKKATVEAIKVKVLTELGIPANLANRIFGETEEEIRQDAEELKKLMGLGTAGKTVGGGTNPPHAGNLQNPWKKESFNLTKQGEILKTNPALAQRLMAEAGVKF